MLIRYRNSSRRTRLVTSHSHNLLNNRTALCMISVEEVGSLRIVSMGAADTAWMVAKMNSSPQTIIDNEDE